MIKPEQIPDEVVKQMLDEVFDTEVEDAEWCRKIIAAAINKWPGFKAAWFLPQGKVYILPAPWENPKPQEKNDD